MTARGGPRPGSGRPPGAKNTKELCGSTRAHSPLTCTLPAGWGTTHPGAGHCRKHLGNSPNHQKQADQIMHDAAVQRAVAEFGLEVETTAEDALLSALWRAQGLVNFYRDRVIEAGEDKMVYGTDRVTRTARPAPGAPGKVIEDVTVVKSQPSVWVRQLEGAERHLLAVGSAVASLNIEHRRVQIAKEQGALFVAAMARVLGEYGVPDDDPRLPVIVGRVVDELSAAR
jgi:hypothetical protein